MPFNAGFKILMVYLILIWQSLPLIYIYIDGQLGEIAPMSESLGNLWNLIKRNPIRLVWIEKKYLDSQRANLRIFDLLFLYSTNFQGLIKMPKKTEDLKNEPKSNEYLEIPSKPKFSKYQLAALHLNNRLELSRIGRY